MKTMTKAEMARELDALRHRVSQLGADNARLMAENDTLRRDLQQRTRHEAPCTHNAATHSVRAVAMQRAKEEALRTGKSVPVRL